MNDYELVSGLIDSLTYLIPILLGLVLLVIGLIRRKKERGGSALIGVGVALLAVFGLGAVGKALTFASSSTSPPTVAAQSADQSSERRTTSTTASSTSTTSAPIPADPLSPPQHVWCLGSDENRVRVVLTALLLDLRSGNEAAVRRFLDNPDPPDDSPLVVRGIVFKTKELNEWERDHDLALHLADSWPEGDHWLRDRANVDGSQPGDQPSPWAIACATAYEAFRG